MRKRDRRGAKGGTEKRSVEKGRREAQKWTRKRGKGLKGGKKEIGRKKRRRGKRKREKERNGERRGERDREDKESSRGSIREEDRM